MALIRCPACGKNMTDIAFVCPHCGHPMRSQTTSSSSESGSNGGSSFIGGVIGTILLAFLGLLLAAFC